MDAKDKRIAELEALLQAALERIATLEAEIAVLKKNSSNSSKQPSSDIVKPSKQSTSKGKKRKRGAQKGHKRNLRKPFEENQVDKIVELDLKSCPTCGGKLVPLNEPSKIHHQVELADKPFVVAEYRQGWHRCQPCRPVAERKASSHRRDRKQKNGRKYWTWCFRTGSFAVFHVDPSRGSVVLENILGLDYAGIISCDFFGAYRKFVCLTSVELQFCWARLIREVKFLAESKDKATARYGNRLLKKIRKMFSTIHRRDELSDRTWRRQMQAHREAIRKVTRSGWGNRWLERFWSVLSTCEQQGTNRNNLRRSVLITETPRRPDTFPKRRRVFPLSLGFSFGTIP